MTEHYHDPHKKRQTNEKRTSRNKSFKIISDSDVLLHFYEEQHKIPNDSQVMIPVLVNTSEPYFGVVVSYCRKEIQSIGRHRLMVTVYLCYRINWNSGTETGQINKWNMFSLTIKINTLALTTDSIAI